MWEYNVVTVKKAFDEISECMTEFGSDNWEIFKIDELIRVNNEVSEKGSTLSHFRLYMKRQTK